LKIYGLFLFVEKTITGTVYLDMLEDFLIPQITEDGRHRNVVFQRDGAPPNFHADVQDFLDLQFPVLWIGRAAPI
jgi:hypothetical protein